MDDPASSNPAGILPDEQSKQLSNERPNERLLAPLNEQRKRAEEHLQTAAVHAGLEGCMSCGP